MCVQRMMRRSFLVGALAVVIGGSMCAFSSAQAFSVEPAIQDLRLVPGASEDRELVFRNTEASPVRVALSVQAFEAGVSGEPRFLDPSIVAGLPSWIRVSAPVFVLEPGASRRVRVQIAVPADAERRGYYVAIIASEQLSGESSVGFARRLATLWMVSVGGDQDTAVPKLAFQDEMQTRWRFFGRGGVVETSVRNSGVVHGSTRVRTTIQPSIGSLIVHEQDIRLLPNESRALEATWESSWPAIRLMLTQELLNNEGKVISTTRSTHWVGETLIGGGVVFMAVFLLSVAYFVRRSRRRRFTVS
ncbi:hypothetical protein KBD13_00055 [Patescibacteria group bacterium]|nr:hypothetical protein [Patescibacteria group bacterium]